MKTLNYPFLLFLSLIINTSILNAQTNVFNDVIASSPNHTYLEAALIQEGLDAALIQNPNVTVFAPDDNAFLNLATSLNTNIAGLLALPNLSDILLYHVLGVSANSSSLTNGDIVTPLNTANTIKLTVNTAVYANQAMVNAPDLLADNGVVHSTNAVLLPNETVIDIAIDNGFTSLSAAIVQEGLLPVLTDPFATFTVFAPTDQAFTDIATALGTDINGLLALPNLSDILTYHVVGADVAASAVVNGLIAQPVSTTNTLKFTVSSNEVYVNHALVTATDILADNGRVHIIDAVVLPSETVVDVAINNGFSSLAAAVIQAQLLPALTNPLNSFTVFAPTNQAFDDLAVALGTDINGLLANPLLTDILLYHTVSGTVLSTDLSNGQVTTLQGDQITVDLSMNVMINDAEVTSANILAENGVVHVIDKVLLPAVLNVSEIETIKVDVYPNPSSDFINISYAENAINQLSIYDINGALIQNISPKSNNLMLDVTNYSKGNYVIVLSANDNVVTKRITIK